MEESRDEQHTESDQDDRPLTPEEYKEFRERLKIVEDRYLGTFMQEHPDFPAKAAVWFSNRFNVNESLPNVTDCFQLDIPNTLKEFQLLELEVAYMLAANGCSDRMIGSFLNRDKTTVAKYLDPIRAVLRSPLEPAEKEKRVRAVATQICDGIRKRTEREAAKI